MIEKYIIGKEDLPKLIRGEELPLSQGSKARAFKIEIIENLTNGDIIKNLFPNCEQKEHIQIYRQKWHFWILWHRRHISRSCRQKKLTRSTSQCV
jgi:hypothetical protein